MILAKVLNVIHPLILKVVVDNITLGGASDKETYFAIGWYVLVRFASQFVDFIREVPFANVSASAETHIAHMVYHHI